jgi:hypothetical protein
MKPRTIFKYLAIILSAGFVEQGLAQMIVTESNLLNLSVDSRGLPKKALGDGLKLSAREMTDTNGSLALWNGHDLAGWKWIFTNEVRIEELWSATNSVLHLAGKPMGYLRTEKVFADFHVHAEWRWPVALSNDNSGLFVFMNRPEAIWPVSVECQLKIGSAGELVGQGGVDFTAPLINGKKRAKISRSSEHAIGAWNAYDIYCRTNTIETFVNGARQIFVDQVTVSSGNIGLQLEGFPVEFRNMWVKSLTE